MVPREEGRFPAPDGQSLCYRRCSPEAPRGRVIVLHGAMEHGDRYGHLYDSLTAAGYAVAGADWRGHGRSEGLRGHVDDFGTYVGDTLALLDLLGPARGPQVLYAHSMGALVALRLAVEHPDLFDGIVLAGAAIRLVRGPGRLTVSLARAAALLFPLLPVRAGIRSGDLSTDEAVGATARGDPLMVRRVTLKWGLAFFRAAGEAEAYARRIARPVLVLTGADDGIADPGVAEDLARWIPDGLASVEVFPGLRHELHNETLAGREAVFGRLLRWLETLPPRAIA